MRKIIKKMGILLPLMLVLPAVAIVDAVWLEPRLLVTNARTVSVPADVNAGKIVFFSDVHLGKLTQEGVLARIVDAINRQAPELVIFGGDFFDNYARDKALLDLDAIAQALSQITAKYGKYAVFGNHDYGGGAVRVYEDLMTRGGFTVLKNESVFVPELNLRVVGYDDFQMGRTAHSLYNLTSESYKIVVSHAPDVAARVSSNTPALMLSGHTHGGQVLLPFVTKLLLPAGGTAYWRGLYEAVGAQENITLFVSKGAGSTALPVRFLTPPEIVALQLKPQA